MLQDRTDSASGQIARTGRLKSVRCRSDVLQLPELTRAAPVGHHQRTGTVARDLQQIRAARESSRAHWNLPHVRVLRVNVPLADLGTSPNLTLITLTSGLRLVAEFHVDPEIAQLEVLLIHFEVRVVLEAPIHLAE